MFQLNLRGVCYPKSPAEGFPYWWLTMFILDWTIRRNHSAGMKMLRNLGLNSWSHPSLELWSGLFSAILYPQAGVSSHGDRILPSLKPEETGILAPRLCKSSDRVLERIHLNHLPTPEPGKIPCLAFLRSNISGFPSMLSCIIRTNGHQGAHLLRIYILYSPEHTYF